MSCYGSIKNFTTWRPNFNDFYQTFQSFGADFSSVTKPPISEEDRTTTIELFPIFNFKRVVYFLLHCLKNKAHNFSETDILRLIKIMYQFLGDPHVHSIVTEISMCLDELYNHFSDLQWAFNISKIITSFREAIPSGNHAVYVKIIVKSPQISPRAAHFKSLLAQYMIHKIIEKPIDVEKYNPTLSSLREIIESIQSSKELDIMRIHSCVVLMFVALPPISSSETVELEYNKLTRAITELNATLKESGYNEQITKVKDNLVLLYSTISLIQTSHSRKGLLLQRSLENFF
eukprot:TRINITY_DN2956_c0_g1_i15.p1 TRINITY_DN2956_c0_g1~~TRINITY_DN2956_c0_g1_i15.p1  ORF type:complete len:289 (+),score=23.02 TRINITY_DN2956_c0_g1_i15:718-1584(+)